MIEFVNVTRLVKSDNEAMTALAKDISISIARNEFVIITGRSGSGKTTLLNIAAGITRPSSGNVFIDDEDIWQMADGELAYLRARKIGYILQKPGLIPSLTVLENVALPGRFARAGSNRVARERAVKLLETVKLQDRMDAYPYKLSAGEKKRAVVARALINQPQILLADEPTADLDADTEREIMSLLRDVYVTGVTFIMVTHNMELVQYASRVLRMENGTLSELTVMAGPGGENHYLLARKPVLDLPFAQ